MAKKVILDSSFLIDVLRFHIDIFKELERCLLEEFEVIILAPTLKELALIRDSQNPKISKAASLALAVASTLPVEEVSTKPGEKVDDLILRVAADRGWAVATNDRALKKKLIDNNIPVIFVRQRSRLDIR
ncbi:MAG: hypothetical protein QXI32_06720 [Candidatus Bathyarchaeia archaeon]